MFLLWLFFVQEDVVSLQKTREELTEELTQLTSKIESLEKDNAQLGELKEKYKVGLLHLMRSLPPLFGFLFYHDGFVY